MFLTAITGPVYLVMGGLSIGSFLCLAGTTREAWADTENSVGISLLAFAFILHGLFVTGASTFGPTPVLKGEVLGAHCVAMQPKPCDSIDVSTGRGYLVDAHLPENIDYLTFYRGDRHVTVEISTWDARIQWIRTDNTNPPTTVGSPPMANYFAVTEVIAGLGLLCLAFVVWREAKRREITRECDPFILLRRMQQDARRHS
jgi:hypothetical protein